MNSNLVPFIYSFIQIKEIRNEVGGHTTIQFKNNVFLGVDSINGIWHRILEID